MSWSECCGCAMAFYAECQRQVVSTLFVIKEFLLYKAMFSQQFYGDASESE